MEQQSFEPMSVGRILDKTFQIYRNNFIRFVTIVAVIQVPIALLNLAFTSLLTENAPVESEIYVDGSMAERPFGAEMSGSREFGWLGAMGTMIAVLLGLIGNMLSQGALIKSVSESYLNREISVEQAYRFVLPKLLTLIGATLMVALVVGLGFVLLIVPGVIFSLWLYLTTSCIVVENLGASAGMSRSKALVSGNLGKVFLIGLLVFLITMVISIPFNIIAGIGTIFIPSDYVMLRTFIGQFASVIAQIIALPIGASAAILLYYDLRIRKEGYDLEMLAQSMSTSGDVADAGPG